MVSVCGADGTAQIIRTLPYGSVRIRYNLHMVTIKAEDVRIPLGAREAVGRHEEVVVVNRERPVYVIAHPDDRRGPSSRRGRPLRDALSLLAQAAPPDPEFVEDMEAVLGSIGPTPPDPWARS